MRRSSYAYECPEWGPCDTHHFVDEDSGDYRPWCDCGQSDPDYRDPDEYRPMKPRPSDPNDPNDQPPF